MKGTHLAWLYTQAHVAESGSPPDKFGALYPMFHIEVHGFNSRIDVSGLAHIGSWY